MGSRVQLLEPEEIDREATSIELLSLELPLRGITLRRDQLL
jgi:hypothetical protein